MWLLLFIVFSWGEGVEELSLHIVTQKSKNIECEPGLFIVYFMLTSNSFKFYN